jgi:ribosomal protein S18 acetylase RimI-like enzyme
MKPGSFVREIIAFKGMNSRTPKLENSAYLLTCFIDKDFRNRGLARSLIGQALKEVPEGTRWLIVDVDVEAVGAIDFYQRCGFKMWSKGAQSSILVLEMEK